MLTQICVFSCLNTFFYRQCASILIGCDSAAELARANFLKHLVNSKDILQFIQHPNNKHIFSILQQKFFGELRSILSPRQMLQTCDLAGVSRRGYEALYKLLTVALRAKGFHWPLLPTTYSLMMSKKAANGEISSLLGGFKCIAKSMPMTNFKAF